MEGEQALNSVTADDLKEVRSYLTYTRVDSDTGEATDRGGRIQVKSLPTEGMSYQLKVDYLLLDGSSDYTCIPLIGHNYIGKNDYSDPDDKLQLTRATAAADHNTMYMYLDPSVNALKDTSLKADHDVGKYTSDYYLSKAYQNKARTIAAVSLKAYNENTNKPIYERDSATGEKNLKTEKILWLYPEAPSENTADYRYFLKFKLSDLDNTTKVTFSIIREIS